MRRSRTESSGAAPAIEELAGGARQVRPAGPRADQYQPGSDFSQAKRSGGRPALRLPRATFSHRRSPCSLHTDYALQKSEIPATVLTSPIRRGLEGDRPSGSLEQHFLTEDHPAASIPTTHYRSRNFPPRYRPRPSEEVQRETGPPAPSSNIFSQKITLQPPYRLRTTEVRISRHGTVLAHPKRSGGRPALRLPRATFSHRRSPCRLHTDYALQKSEFPATVPSSPIRRGPEGDRPSGSLEQQNRAEVPHSASLSTAHGSRKTKTAPFRNTGRGGRKNDKDYFSSRSAREEPETRSAGFFTAPE